MSPEEKFNNYMGAILEASAEDFHKALDSNHEVYLKAFIEKSQKEGV